MVIVNRVIARQLFGGETAIGQCIFAGPLGPDRQCASVVGVAADAKYTEVTREAGALFYRPMGARPVDASFGSVLHVRVAGDAEAMSATIQRELLGLDPSMLYIRVLPLSDLLAPQLAPWQTGSFILTLFGVLGLVLAAIGLYGVIALLVVQRTHEMGVRLALGASRRSVMTLLLGQGARLVAIGLIAGTFAAAAASRLFSSMMYGVSATDPIAYIATALVLTLVALLAAYLPARRATRVDPAVALRVN